MLKWIFGQLILSIVLILLLHYLYNYFKNSLSNTLEKDYINDSKEKYEKMYDIIKKTNNTRENTINKKDFGGSKEDETMKNELKNFINEFEPT